MITRLQLSVSHLGMMLIFIFCFFSLQAQLLSPLEDRVSCNFSDLEEQRLDNLLTNDAIESSSLVTINDPFDTPLKNLYLTTTKQTQKAKPYDKKQLLHTK